MAGAIDGIAAVENRTLAGKIIVYPMLHDVGLIPLAELRRHLPDRRGQAGRRPVVQGRRGRAEAGGRRRLTSGGSILASRGEATHPNMASGREVVRASAARRPA